MNIKLRYIMIALFLPACFTANTRKYDKLDVKRDKYWHAIMNEKVYKTCEKITPPKAVCGYIADKLFSEEYLNSFTNKACGNITKQECIDIFEDMWIARLVERYEFADFKDISNKCSAYPIKCRDPYIIEDWLIESHNTNLDEYYTEKIQNVNGKEDEQRQKDAERAAAIMRQVGNSFDDNSVNCTSTKVGNSIHTSCR